MASPAVVTALIDDINFMTEPFDNPENPGTVQAAKRALKVRLERPPAIPTRIEMPLQPGTPAQLETIVQPERPVQPAMPVDPERRVKPAKPIRLETPTPPAHVDEIGNDWC